jgi:hypothetical protein
VLFLVAAALVAAWSLGPAAAQAQSTCAGVYSAARLQPMPNPLTVQLEVWDNSPSNIALAARFTTGMRNAGVQVSARPTAKLRLNVQLQDGNNDVGGGSSQDSQYSEWNGLQGGLTRTYPDMPEEQLLQRRRADGPANLMMRAELRTSDDAPVAWVATVQCQVQTDSMPDLAADMGSLIGKSLGRTVESQRF